MDMKTEGQADDHLNTIDSEEFSDLRAQLSSKEREVVQLLEDVQRSNKLLQVLEITLIFRKVLTGIFTSRIQKFVKKSGWLI